MSQNLFANFSLYYKICLCFGKCYIFTFDIFNFYE